MFALASWLTNTQAGRVVDRVRQKLNGRVSDLTHEAGPLSTTDLSLMLWVEGGVRCCSYLESGARLTQLHQ